eukprot:scaffold40785_cov30-Tisochrysis_lutea.AAC.2
MMTAPNAANESAAAARRVTVAAFAPVVASWSFASAAPTKSRAVKMMRTELVGRSTPLLCSVCCVPLLLAEILVNANQRPSAPTATMGASQPCRSELSVTTRARPKSAPRADGSTNAIAVKSATGGGKEAASAPSNQPPSTGGACAGPAKAAVISAPPLTSDRRQRPACIGAAPSAIHASCSSARSAVGVRLLGVGTAVHASATHATSRGSLAAEGRRRRSPAAATADPPSRAPVPTASHRLAASAERD